MYHHGKQDKTDLWDYVMMMYDHMGPILLTLINFNSAMITSLHAQ